MTDAANRAVLSIRDLTVELPVDAERAHAVEDVSFDVQAGEIVCLVGESGSGKSVTAQAVLGLLPPGQLRVTGGAIELEGEDLRTAPAARLRSLRGRAMAMIFQEPMTALNPVLTVGEQVREVFETHGVLNPSERRERVIELFRSVQLPDPERLVNTYPHQLSGGQRQRVMIAMAFALEPALLVADEPTTALDVTTQARILEIMRTIQRARGSAVLFITHDFGVVADIADRVVVMRTGRV
ncbi:MAG: ABC transporter ATP-binding protein, partial [Acidobacteria bacterium]|nr:ABC transporter ATP-binding protein [Acidobacteriota bacterium]